MITKQDCAWLKEKVKELKLSADVYVQVLKAINKAEEEIQVGDQLKRKGITKL
jgi:hypothetical protein